MPAHVGVLWPTPDDARACPKGDMILAYCGGCGFVSNLAFDPVLVDYAQSYDNSLHASAVFRAFEGALVDRLIDRYGLRDKDVIDIGCGDGHFLRLLCERGDNRGVGIDPSYDPGLADPLARDRVTFIPEYYSEAHVDQPVDLFVCRHVLEHIPNPIGLLTVVRRALDGREPGPVVYFEVPNSMGAFRRLAIWDLIYEHCSYFSAGSLRYLFESLGFEVLSVAETYGGQFLSVEARASSAGRSPWTARPMDLSVLRRLTADFAYRFADRRRTWRENLDRLAEAGRRVVVWGGGARAVSFFNMLGIGGEVAFVVDINERKQGTYLAGTGHTVVAPNALTEYRPEVVIVLNPLYTSEIEASLRDLGVHATVVTV